MKLTMLLVTFCLMLASNPGQSKIVKTVRLFDFEQGDFKCYENQANQTAPAPTTCPTFSNRCASCSFELVQFPGLTETVYFCADNNVCSDQESYCKKLEEAIKMKIKNCKLTCCETPECNQPKY